MTSRQSRIPALPADRALGTVAWLIAASVCTAPVAFAEEDAASAGSAPGILEEIVVSAQRRETSLQTTAVSVTALSSSNLIERSIKNVEDLGIVVPGMQVSFYQGEAQIYIRGIGQSSAIGGGDSPTALHLDGVYVSRSANATSGLFDLERVEVLRGPQGTLYGRNSTAGSINLISRGPTQEFEYEARATLGNHDRMEFYSAIGGPVSETIGVRLAAQVEERDGYTRVGYPVEGAPPGQRLVREAEDKSDRMARLTVVAKPTDTLTVTLKGDYYEANDRGAVWHYFGPGLGTQPLYQALAPESIRPRPYERRNSSNVNYFNKPRMWGAQGRIEWTVGDYRISSLTAYRKTRPYNYNDLDLTYADAADQLRQEDQKQFSQEIQITSPTDGALKWIAGVYYFDETNDIRNEYRFSFIDTLFGLPEDPSCCTLNLNGSLGTKAVAAFGEATYDVGGRLSIVAGARYSTEKRSGNNLVVFDGIPPIMNNVTELEAKRYHAFTPKFGVNFSATERIFLYASASKGFKSGGFNAPGFQNEPFDPEFIWAYEAGLKATTADRRLRTNVAVFLYDYSDLQIADVEAASTVIRNAAESRITGVDVELSWLPLHNLRIDAGVSWLDAKFSKGLLLDPAFPERGVQDLDGRSMPKAPEWKLALGVQYDARFATGAVVSLRADYAWQDEIYFSAFNVPDLHEGSFGWAKARVTFAPASDRWSISAFIDNATDEKVASSKIFNGSIIGGTVTGNLAPPRTYGLAFTIRN